LRHVTCKMVSEIVEWDIKLYYTNTNDNRRHRDDNNNNNAIM